MSVRIQPSQLESIRPDYVVNGIVDLDPDQLSELNVENLLFDFDNTIVGFGEQPRKPQLNALRRLGRAGFNMFVVTNAHTSRLPVVIDSVKTVIPPGKIITPESCTSSRIKSIIAEKPSPAMINYTLGEYSLTAADTLLVGDRIFNDILAGNRAGVKTALVPSLGKEHLVVEKIQRPVETIVRRILGLPVDYADFPSELKKTIPTSTRRG